MKKKIIIVTIFLVVFTLIFGWKIPVILRLNCLELPMGCEQVYRAKVRLSDVYWLHIKGEKIVKCDLGYEETKKYIMEHNSASELVNIDISAYAGMSDISIYDSEFDEEFKKQPDLDSYIRISYLKKLE